MQNLKRNYTGELTYRTETYSQRMNFWLPVRERTRGRDN